MMETTDTMVRTISDIPASVGATTCFGPPVERDGHTLIPVARVSFGYGLGFGRGSGTDNEADHFGNGHGPKGGGEGEGGGGGGGGNSTPVAVIDISRDEVAIKPIIDSTKITTTSLLMVSWVAFWLFWTVRTLARESAKTRRHAVDKGLA